MSQAYDAVLVVSFGGPDKMDDVLPFLENVLRGKNVPRERMLEVAHHYEQFGGVSPLNDQNRQLIANLQRELAEHGPALPIYWGNRNWHPLLTDALRQMAADGVRRAIAFATSAYSSYSGCRQYLEDIERARAEVGASAPVVDKLRVFFNHPGFVEPCAERVQEAFDQIPEPRRESARLLFTAHSIPQAMADNCRYEEQLKETCRLICKRIGRQSWELVYQSRSGPPSQPWLEPDVNVAIRAMATSGEVHDLVIAPVGFLSDHMEILFDLDTEARQLCQELGINLVRAQTVGTHPAFVRMIRELILERTSDQPERRAIGQYPPSHDVCQPGCCTSGRPTSTKHEIRNPKQIRDPNAPN
jgi:ferrochelatase